MIDWEICKQDFNWDGSWRDIYVFDTTIEDWQQLLDFLRKEYKVQYSVDGEERDLPFSVSDIFSATQQACIFIKFQVSIILFSGHFFSQDTIEFDIDPCEVTSQIDLDIILDFMQRISFLINKSIVLTPENAREYTIIDYDSREEIFTHHEQLLFQLT